MTYTEPVTDTAYAAEIARKRRCHAQCAASEVGQWITRHGQVHDAHITAATADLVIAGWQPTSECPQGAVTIDVGDIAPEPGAYINWSRWWPDAHHITITDDGTPVWAETRHLIHSRECASTTCIDLWRRGHHFTRTHPGIDRYRMLLDHWGYALLFDYEAYDQLWPRWYSTPTPWTEFPAVDHATATAHIHNG